MGVSISVNTSPLAGKAGSKLTLGDLKERLLEEAQNDVALTVKSEGKSSIQVKGRGDMHIGILLQKLRREGYQFSVTPPEIMFKKDPQSGKLL